MPLPPELDLMPRISAAAENDNTLRLARRIRDEMVADAEAAILNPRAPAVKLSNREWHDKIMDYIADAYYLGPRSEVFPSGSWADYRGPFAEFYDAAGIQAEIELLMRDDLGDGLQQGVLPPPRALPFAKHANSGLWLLAEVWARLFKRWHALYGEEV